MSLLLRQPSALRKALIACCAVLLLALPKTAAGQSVPSQVVVFGDSLSDTGNGFVFVGTSSTPPDYGMNQLLIPDAPYARGGHHLTNGATWIEQLVRPRGLARSARPAFGSSSPYAMNFAIGTARARDDGQNPSLALEVGAFLQKTGFVAPSDALYVIQIGGNDIRDAVATGDPVQGAMILQAALTSIASAIQTLYAAGARNFLIWSVPDAGLTPLAQFLETLIPGTIAAASLATTTFNAGLSAALAPLAALPGINLVPFDAYTLVNTIVAAPGAFGLTNVTDACVTPNVAPFACQNPDDYLFWDGIHPTAAAHAIVAQAVALLLGI
jgi:phospholipase/lecithinase/hemolysin